METPIPFPQDRQVIGHLSTDTSGKLPAFPRSKHRQLPRLFEIVYDARHFHLKERHTLWGTQYPNGCITLENGVVFPDGITELQEHFKRAGKFEMRWVSIMEVAEGE